MNMTNTFYLLSSSTQKAEKFHLCTWDVRNQKTFIEVGVCIKKVDGLPDEMVVFLALPFVTKGCIIESLHTNLSELPNYRFIFNEMPESATPIGGDIRNGSLIRLKGEGQARGKIYAVVNANPEVVDNYSIVKNTIRKPTEDFDYLYFRILIKTETKTIAEVIPEITKKTFIYDIKLNEARNIPDDVFKYMYDNHLNVVKVMKAYCLHCVPDNMEIGYNDSTKMKNVRKLEIDAFMRYMPWLTKIKGKYIITFEKDDSPDGSSFFTTFTKEYIGNIQIMVAVCTNLLCNLLFAIAAFRVTRDPSKPWISQIPIEWWVAIVIFIIGCIICFCPLRKLLKN